MANIWTEEQKKVIELHNRNILVSAAAGSGKTAVLVERIIRMITRKEAPVDIDRLVVVTFTNMAAYEMRMRIMAAIEKEIEREPDNQHLNRQLTLVHSARITTIDSFCLNIVKSYFSEADLDPAFRVADEGELKLLSADVMKAVLEERYSSGEEEFYQFVDCFAPQKTDEKIEEYILRLYRFSQSYPWPREWLESCIAAYDCNDLQAFMESDILRFFLSDLKKMAAGIAEDIETAYELCSRPGGPYMYMDALQPEYDIAQKLRTADSYEELRRVLDGMSFARLSSKRDESVAKELREAVKDIRDGYKKNLDKLKKEYCALPPQEIFEQAADCRPQVKILIELTLDYMERMDKMKREKKIINFNDMEHIALNILVHKEDGRLIYTNAADELSARYEEILIDEYQDSNMVQELILTSISRERFGDNNIFMVGDVKQSIYKFRLARPELFIEKYNRYSVEESSRQKIELHKNFRSRALVLDGVNDVFQSIMSGQLGGVDYDENAMLYVGADFPESQEAFDKAQILFLEHEEDYEYSNVAAEAALVANQIIALVMGKAGKKIYDKKTGTYRTPRPGDIVILMRSLKGWADTFVEVLNDKGVDACSESATGYFSAVEIRTLMSLLAVIDNPRQDIALAAVMRSYFGGFTDDELAMVKAQNTKVSLYDALLHSDMEKAQKLLAVIENYREYSQYMEISRLVWKLAYETGFYDYAGSMPAGSVRQGNISMLVEKARQYESTSYKGLFHFLRYMDKLKSYEVDFAGTIQSGEQDGIVQVMSIHKSKGLEFPIVFLAGMMKGFNNVDARDGIIIEPDFGVGIDYVNTKKHIKKPTLMKKIIARKIVLDNLAEEQRILYVALTRAKEMLYLTGCHANSEKAMEKWNRFVWKQGMSYVDISEHKNYMDMVMPVALGQGSNHFCVEVIMPEAFEKIKDEVMLKQEQAEPEAEKTPDEEYRYPYVIYDIPVKMSVSEIKQKGMNYDNEGAVLLESFDEEEAVIPNFISQKAENRPTTRGTAYHTFLEHLDYGHCDNQEQVARQLEYLCEKGILQMDWKSIISLSDIMKFLVSEVGQHAKSAWQQDRLYREKQFMTGIPAREMELFKNLDTDEMIIVQGMIDMYYETDEGIVLVDYKTDRVVKGREGRDILKKRYREQLLQYRKAVEMILQKKVAGVKIYSFCLAEVIDLTNE